MAGSWKKVKKRFLYGLIIGITGSAGQLILFQALRTGPAYLVFPFVSLSPLVTILLSLWLLKEKASCKAWMGIIIALIAIPLLSYQPAPGERSKIWLLMDISCARGIFKLGHTGIFYEDGTNNHMKAESIFFYMMISRACVNSGSAVDDKFPATNQLGL